jgi:hypothetical protein
MTYFQAAVRWTGRGCCHDSRPSCAASAMCIQALLILIDIAACWALDRAALPLSASPLDLPGGR